MRRKLLIFHPTIAPYRIDFFNDLYQRFETEIVLYYRNLKNQKFNYDKIEERFVFSPIYLEKYVRFLGREMRMGHTKMIRRKKPDMIIVGEYSFGVWCSVLHRLFSKKKYKIITICDDSLKIAQECSGLRKLSRELLIRHLDGIILDNEQVEEWYRAKYPKVNTFVFPIIQEEDQFRKQLLVAIPRSNQLMEEYTLEGKKVLLYVGRIAPEKNLGYLIRSFAKSCKEQKDSRLILIGEENPGSTAGLLLQLEKMVQELHMEQQILFLGRKEGEELLAWYNIGQVFVLPSTYEPFGAVVNEALLAGERVLVSKNAGSTCLVTQANGQVIDIEKPQLELEEQLKSLSPCGKLSGLRENAMPFTYRQCMDQLISWMNYINEGE